MKKHIALRNRRRCLCCLPTSSSSNALLYSPANSHSLTHPTLYQTGHSSMAPVGRRRLSFPSSSSSYTSSASSFLLLLLLLLASATAFLLPSSLPSSFSSSSLTTRRQQQQQQQLSRRVGTLVYAGEDNVEIGVRREGGREGGREDGVFKE